MRKIYVAILCLFAFAATLTAQPVIPNYYSSGGLLPAAGGVYSTGFYGYDNPAYLSTVRTPEGVFLYSADQVNKDFGTYGILSGGSGIGTAFLQTKTILGTVNDYALSFGAGDRTLGFGFGYQWASGNRAAYGRTDMVAAGFFFRPNEYLSLGASGRGAVNYDVSQGVLELGVRPFGTYHLALFGDIAMDNTQSFANSKWSAGVLAEPIDGIRISARYFDTQAFAIGVGVSFGTGGISVQPVMDKNSKHVSTTAIIRSGGYDRNIFRNIFDKDNGFVKYEMKKPVSHTRGTFFNQSEPLTDLLREIEHAKNDPAISGIVINTTTLRGGRTLLWEVREKLKEFRTSGKKVVMYIERSGIDLYHFASVADHIIMDPLGQVQLGGYLMGRSFIKGTLEKIGVGMDELRFFTYKSAVEPLSRDKMSDADREQRQALVDDMYSVVKENIMEGRDFTSEKFETLLNSKLLYTAEEALREGLVDTLARWTSIDDLIEKYTGEKKSYAKKGMLEGEMMPYATWSEPPHIAVIYALGACAMDDGIRARDLEKKVSEAVKDNKVKAIILRVDSPGGDAMASDYVSEVLKGAKGKKPVVISQADVAASGGYWISMYSDAIVAAPNTVTGSIGVISGWLYNKGFKESVGGSVDFVKAGKYADLGFGFTTPIIPITIPDRPLTEDERGQLETMIRGMYKDFVTKVAEGRGKQFDEIEKVAQGRVWSGLDGKEIGLVDYVGGIEVAIAVAKEKAGIPKDGEVKIKEYSVQPYFALGDILPFFGIRDPIKEDPTARQIKFRFDNNGRPMPMQPLDEMEIYAR